MHSTTRRSVRPIVRGPIRRAGARFAVALAGCGLAGCGGVEPVATHEPITDPAQLYSSLTLDHVGITLSTAAGYNTLQLTATPRDALGHALVGLPAPTFRSTDTTAVSVTAEGLLTARAVATGVSVIAEVAGGNLRHADTARVNVTDLVSPPTLASVAIDPVAPDDSIWPVFPERTTALVYPLFFLGQFTLPMVTPRAVSTEGSPINEVVVKSVSLDPAIAQVNPWNGEVTPKQPGQARMVARTTAYGVAKVDTATFTVTLPIGEYVEVTTTLSGVGVDAPEVRIMPQGYVMWANRLGQAVDLAFDAPANVVAPSTEYCGMLEALVAFGVLQEFAPGPYCADGDVHLAANGGPRLLPVQVRHFPVPGVYPYRNPVSGATGRVVVTTEAAAP